MLDLFDTIGTIVGCATNAGLNDENGKPEDYNKIMYADSATTVMSAIVGTSTVSTFVESGAGIAEGGKTGLTGLTIAILFLFNPDFFSNFLTSISTSLKICMQNASSGCWTSCFPCWH